MKTTEKNQVSAGLLVSAAATEWLMREWLNMEHKCLVGDNKLLFNGMVRGIKTARYYYEQFVDKVQGILVDEDGEALRADQMRMDAADLIRLYLTAANMHANGYSVQSILDALNKTIDKEENPKFPVSREYIDKFIVQ